jgi:hypothetical protein
MTRLRLLFSAGAAALLVSACGGSDDSAPPAVMEPQMQREDREASTTIAGLIAFAKAQLASFTSDAAEPRAVGGINPPTSETAEPLPL